MARVAGKNTKVYVDEFDFSGKISTGEMTVDVNLPEVTSFDDTGSTFVEGLPTASITQNGFFDAEAGGFDEEMWADIVSGVLHLVGLYPGNSAAQEGKGYEIQAMPKSNARPIEIAGAVLLNVTWQGSGAVVRSTVLCNGAVVGTGAVSDSNQNVGATVAGERFVAILRVLEVDGTGSITVQVQESQNDGDPDTYAELLTFTAATGVTSERKTTILATEAWKRVYVTAFSGFTSVTILVVVGKEQGVS